MRFSALSAWVAVAFFAAALDVGALVSRTAGMVLAIIGLVATLTVRRTPFWDRFLP